MKNKNTFKTSLYAILLIFNLLTPISASASAQPPGSSITVPVPAPPAEHKQTITSYLDSLTSIHNIMFELVQNIFNSTPEDLSKINQTINFLRNQTSKLRQQMRDYLSALPSLGQQSRDVLLLFNALNFTETALSSLISLQQTTNKPEKVMLLESYFNARAAAINTINTLQATISSQ